jgi:glutathione S-transferase
MNFVSIHGWHRMVGIIARNIESGEFEKLLENIPLHEQREKWRTARSGFSRADLDNATRKIEVALAKVEGQLAETLWLAGAMYTLADINFYSHCGMMIDRMFPDLAVDSRFPRLADWRERVSARPATREALAMPDHTAPGLRTWSGAR